MSEEKKMVPVDTAHIREGDVVKVPMVREGMYLAIAVDGERRRTLLDLPVPGYRGEHLSGLTVYESDIVRAPVPREVVTVEYEVVPFSEMKAGDYREAETGLHFIYHEDAVRLRRNLGLEHASEPPRVLRPIKKP